MHFKIDGNLKIVAAAKSSPATPENVARGLCAKMIEAGMFSDDPDNYGESVVRVTGPQLVSRVCDVLSEYLGIDTIPAKVFDAFCALVIMGEGDCPHCGGELRFIETEGHELKDGDYFTPNSYEIDNYIYECRNCGEIIKSETEL